MTIQEKIFYLSNSDEIFKNCNAILSKVSDGLFIYDGIENEMPYWSISEKSVKYIDYDKQLNESIKKKEG